MVAYSPLILVSGLWSQLPPGDTIKGVSASGDAAYILAEEALASGNAALVDAAEALASGNAALVDAESALANISGYSVAPSGAFGGTAASIVLLSDLVVQSQVNISGQGGLAVQFESDVITISGGTGAGGGGAVGSGNGEVFFLNDTVISGSYVIPSGKNAMSAGPLTQLSGVVVTIPSGSAWTIV